MEYKLEVKNYKSNSTVFLTTDDESFGSIEIQHDQYGDNGDSGNLNSKEWNEAAVELKTVIGNFTSEVGVKIDNIENADEAIDSILSAMQRN